MIVRILGASLAIILGLWLTSSGVHEVSIAALTGGYVTAAGYMLLVSVALIAVERTLHPGVDWLTLVEEDPRAVATVLAGALIAFALITAYAVP